MMGEALKNTILETDSMDMTAVMDLIYKNMSTVLGAGEELTMGVNQLLVTIDNIHYNDAQDFVIPEEAKQ